MFFFIFHIQKGKQILFCYQFCIKYSQLVKGNLSKRTANDFVMQWKFGDVELKTSLTLPISTVIVYRISLMCEHCKDVFNL